jgi:hypothetical protein
MPDITSALPTTIVLFIICICTSRKEAAFGLPTILRLTTDGNSLAQFAVLDAASPKCRVHFLFQSGRGGTVCIHAMLISLTQRTSTRQHQSGIEHMCRSAGRLRSPASPRFIFPLRRRLVLSASLKQTRLLIILDQSCPALHKGTFNITKNQRQRSSLRFDRKKLKLPPSRYADGRSSAGRRPDSQGLPTTSLVDKVCLEIGGQAHVSAGRSLCRRRWSCRLWSSRSPQAEL